MENRKLFWMYFVMLTAPVCVYVEMIMAISGIAGAYDHSWIGTAIGVCFPFVWIYWLVAVVLNVVRYGMAFANKDLEDGDSLALHYANFLNFPILPFFVVYSRDIIPAIFKSFAHLIF